MINKKIILLTSLAFLSLAGCQNHADSVKNIDNSQPPDMCQAASFHYLVGKPASILDGMRFAKPMRHIVPNTGVTMDFNAERLNIVSDQQGVISQVYCG
ncbi:I78 family peptidase inhibitor [Rouxiella sp. Mn2063]|uniref:I78 family peptidase inhibitor n=1 Tax=Rouxiella sp. Mn2063 TaxID=3395262 RepID=UPI003BEB6C76